MPYPKPFSRLQKIVINSALLGGRSLFPLIRPWREPSRTNSNSDIIKTYPCGMCDSSEEIELFVLDLRSHYRADILYYPEYFNPESYPTHRLVRCANCGLVRVNPRISNEVLLQHYGSEKSGVGAAFEQSRDLFGWQAVHNAQDKLKRAKENKHAESAKNEFSYLPGQIAFGKELLQYCKKMLPETKKIRFLDIGCASGWTVRAAHESGWDACGLEPSPEIAELAKTHSGGEIHNIFYEEEKQLPRESFDLVLSLSVMEHVFRPDLLADYYRDMLSTGGIAVIRTPCLSLDSSRIQGRYWRFFSPEHIHLFDDNSMAGLFNQRGFELVDKVVSCDFGIKWHLREILYSAIKRFLAERMAKAENGSLMSRSILSALHKLGLIIDLKELRYVLSHMEPYWFPCSNDDQLWIFRKR